MREISRKSGRRMKDAVEVEKKEGDPVFPTCSRQEKEREREKSRCYTRSVGRGGKGKP